MVGDRAAKMPPLWNQRTPPWKMAFQSKSPGFRRPAASLRTVVEDHRRAHAVAAVAVDGGHVRAGDAVVREMLVKRADAHGANTLVDHIADGVIDHGGDDTGIQAEAVREVRGHVELAAADVNVAVIGLAERNRTGIQAVYESTERHQIEGSLRGDGKGLAHVGLTLHAMVLAHRLSSWVG